MRPYAEDGDYAVTTRIFFNIRIGDVLVFKSPLEGNILIKRVKRIDLSQEGKLYFMEGDNRMRSVDSNRFGSIGRDSVIGKVLFLAKGRKNQ